MLRRSIGAALLALLCLWPAHLDAFVAQSLGCHHNGTWYADRSLVPTVEKCLTCQCQRKTLVCRLKVCPEMPMPPPRGCIVVQQRNACCPYLSCARLDAFYKIPATRRIIAYLDHYERESIDRVVNDNMLQRRSDDSEVDMYVCVKNGTVYKSGSAMSSSNLCTYCYCIGGTEKCVKPKCMLPVEGCKPIFVDSTCCPVRYDCTSKPSGKSSQEVRYRKTSNKHYLRMSQRLQRNRGCTVNKQFYVEGQKMRSDPDKPCDICFCIRGTRRCAPKKCSPALKNCIPVVPKGQCCPSSYDCGSQRAQSSRQFNLFSLLFGKEDELNGNDTKKIPAEYPPDRHPSVTVTHNQNILEKNDEKSILDTIREGLEIIDGNNDEVIAQNIEKLAAPLTQVVTESQINTQSTVPENAATEVSFLDLLLGADDDELSTKVTEEVTPELKTTTGYDGLSWVDILLGPDEDDQKQTGTTAGDRASIPETTTNNQNAGNGTSIDRIDQDFEDFSGSGEIIVGEPLSSESSESSLVAYPVLHKSSIDKETYVTLQKPLLNNTSVISVVKPGELTVSTTESPKTTYSTTAATTKLNATKTPQSTVSVKQTTPTAKTTQRPAIKSSAKPTQSTTKATPKPSQKPIELKFKPRSTQKPIEKLQKTTTSRPLNITQTELQNTIEKKKNGLLTALLDGLSDMLNSENVFNSTQNKIPSNSTTTTSTTTNRPKDTIVLPTPKPKPLPSFKPLPMRINSKIANLTVTAEVVKTSLPPNVTAFKPLPGHMVKSPIVLTSTQAPVTTTTTPQSSTSVTSTTTTSSTTTEKSTTTTGITSTTTKTTTASSTPAAATSSSTLKPVLINTNPTILESDPFDANAEPTLPPSLPNLKIIPFLPTDAVKADRTKPLYDYYHSNAPTAKIDYDQYDEGNIYPAITEPHFPNYSDIADGSKAEYIYKFNVEGPSPPVTSSTAGKSDGSSGGAAAFVKYDFVGAGDEHKGFSPPTETEGGFVPKDPLVLSDTDEQVDTLPYVDTSYQVTKHLIDITTADPLRENSTKVIEITTPDPFKDVIRTEQPPDLTSLIEDKEHILVQKPIQLQPPKVFEDPENISQSLIHITTAVPQSANALDDELPPLTMFAETTNEQNDSRAPNEEHQNTIASFLDLLLGGEIDLAESHSPHNLNASSTVVPPFKTLPQASLELLPDITTTSATAKPKRVTTTTRVPTNSTATNTTKRIAVKTNSIATSVPSFTKLNGTAFAANNNTKPIPNPKTPITQKTRVGTTSTSITTKISSTTRPKSTRPKSGSTRRQTTKTPIAIAASQKRVNSITALRNPNNRNTTTSPLPSTASKGTAAANKPLQRSPFDTLPFMDTSFEVKRTTERPYVVGQHTGGDFLGLLYYKNSLNQVEGLEPARESALHGASSFSSSATKQTTASTTTTNSVPLVQRNIEQIISATASAPIALDAPTAANPLETQHSASNSLIDPSGVLKLAGCNIYGRMYRVGRIILELSSPCLECKCTEVGVKCGQLEC